MGKVDRIKRLWRLGSGGGKRVVAVWGLIAATALTWGASSGGLGGWTGLKENGEESAALEEAFFETLGRCESPLLVERNEAEDALFERFAEFEPIWQDRRFLTNGEIGAEARQRFELAEARYREKASNDCVAAFETTFETVASEESEGQNSEDKEEKEGEAEGGNRENRKNGELLRGRVRLRWERPLRIVYLAPDWSAFERRDADGKRWRPSGRFSAPELAPEFDASELTLETIWERVDEEETALNEGNEENRENGAGEGNEKKEKSRENGASEGNEKNGKSRENGENERNGEGKTAVVGVFEGLIGGDFRVWTTPLGPVAFENAMKGKNEKEESKESDVTTASRATDLNVDFPTVFQSGDAVATVGETTIKENGETTARVRFEFAEAFDAFDSHRVWCDKGDFALVIDAGNDKAGASDVFDVSDAENESRTETKADEEAEASEKGRRWAPIRSRVRERSANGALFELDFPNDAALRKAVATGRARLACRVPRFFFWTRFNVEGTEKGNDEKTVNVDAAEISGSAADVEND